MPWWAVIIVAVWALEVGAYVMLTRDDAHAPALCPLRQATGLPCPTCGGTRAALAAARGDLPAAFRLNPLVMVAACGVALWLILRVGFARRITVRRAPIGRGMMWMAVLTLVALNWVYVIARERAPRPETGQTHTLDPSGMPARP